VVPRYRRYCIDQSYATQLHRAGLPGGGSGEVGRTKRRREVLRGNLQARTAKILKAGTLSVRFLVIERTPFIAQQSVPKMDTQ
jgi:hypothetical protein